MTQPSLPGMAKYSPRPSTLPGAKRATPERDEQQELIRWRDLHSRPGAPDRIEALGWLHSSLNGEYFRTGQAWQAKASGMTAGVPDLFLPATMKARGNLIFAGLFVEMKAGRNRLTAEQAEFREWAESQGYQHRTCYSWIEAATAILVYLGVPRAHAAWQGLEEKNA